MGRQIDWRGPIGLFVAAVAGSVFFVSAGFNAGRPDLFYLADAFWHGRTWLSSALGPNDVIPLNGHYYVPFPPFPAIMFMPLMLLTSAVSLYYYLVLLKHLYVEKPADGSRIVTPFYLNVTLGLVALAVIVLGLFPEPILALLNSLASRL